MPKQCQCKFRLCKSFGIYRNSNKKLILLEKLLQNTIVTPFGPSSNLIRIVDVDVQMCIWCSRPLTILTAILEVENSTPTSRTNFIWFSRAPELHFYEAVCASLIWIWMIGLYPDRSIPFSVWRIIILLDSTFI